MTVRPLLPADVDGARELYVDVMRPLLTALGRWDEGRVLRTFEETFLIADAVVIVADGQDAGWMQTSENAERIHLHQIHLRDDFRNRGIGSRLMRRLQQRSRRARKTLALNVIRGNPAIGLYTRLGFQTTAEDADKLRMVWKAAPSSPAGPATS